MSSVPARVLNEMFVQKVASAEHRDKIAEEGGSYIRDRLREVSFARKIIPPVMVTRADCQRSEFHDTLVKIIDIEPYSRAMSLTFRGQPTARYIRGDRMAMGFFTISSEMLQKTEQELLAYDMPVTRILEDNSVKDLQEIEDREFILHVEAAVQALQTEANGGTPTALNWSTVNAGTVVQNSIIKGELAKAAGQNDAVVRPLQRPDLSNLKRVISRRRLVTEQMVITEPDLDTVLQWTVQDFGDRMQSETAVDGYKYNTLVGLRLVRTIKTDILREGNIYSFTQPEFFGRFYILNNPKFYIDKKANMLSFQCWEDIGMALANISACAKLELYSADANPLTNADGLLPELVPMDETALGALNNRVSAGLVFPKITVA